MDGSADLGTSVGHVVGIGEGKSIAPSCPGLDVNVLLPCWVVLCMVHCVRFERITTAVHALEGLSAVSRCPSRVIYCAVFLRDDGCYSCRVHGSLTAA